MPSPAQRWPRLVAALEDLVGQETCALHARDFASVNAIADRIGPIIETLASATSEISESALRERITITLTRRSKNADWLATEMLRVRDELRSAGAAQRRVAQVAPAYGSSIGRGARPRVSLVG